MKVIKYYLKAMAVASLVALSPWLAIMFVDMRFIKWWHDEGDRICTATARLDSANHDAAPIVNASWAYGVHDFSLLRVFILLAFIVVMFLSVGIREWGWFDGE